MRAGTLFACFWALMGAIANANAATMSLKRAVNRSIRLYGVDDRLMVRLYLQGASNSPFALMGGMPITWGLVSRFTVRVRRGTDCIMRHRADSYKLCLRV